ncbi:MAG: LysM peptidoglycan-binding domain-containing protein, partial [Treponema sp.]|nr:LysM peptidoglycan-binding domain-containing protein [Treponema sp.]
MAKRSPKRLHNFNKSAPKAQTSSGRNLEKPAFRPEGITALFTQNVKVIEKIRQEPVKNPRRNAKIKKLFQKRQSVSANEDVHERVSQRAEYGTPSDEAESSKPQKRRGRSWTSFAVSVFSITAVFLAVIGVYYIVQSQNLNLDWTSHDVINTSPDSPIQHSLARYAGVALESAITVWETPLDGAPVQVIAGVTQAMPGAAQAMAGTTQAMVTGAQAPREIPLDLMETFEWQSYRVQRGDSVSTIAQRFSVSMDAIIASNNITNARALRAGELLRIPNMDGIPHVVESGDSLAGISARFGVPLEAILDANDIQSDVIYSGTTLFIPGARMNRDELRMALGDQLFVHPV